MRALRLLAIIMMFAAFAATPHIGKWVATANASSGPLTAGQEAVNAPANDNDESQEELCNSDNPRKQKKCHYNESNGADDNDNPDNPWPSLAIGVSNADPNEDDTITLTLHAWGNDIDQVWWWVPDELDDNGNENEDFTNEARVFTCDGSDDCVHTSDLTPRHDGTFTIHARARDYQGRETDEIVTEVRVHDE